MAIPTGLSFGSASSSPLSVYNNMLNFASQNYQNITAGYESVLSNQRNAEAAVQAGYSNLQGNVHAMVQNIGAGQNLQNQQTYADAQGRTQNQMINAGLGNTTVMGQEQLKNTGNYAIAQNSLADQIAQLQAGYYTQIGLAGLNYMGQSVNADTALQTHQLDYMGNQSYPYMQGMNSGFGSGMGGGGGGGSVGAMGGGAGGVQGLGSGGYHIGNIPGGSMYQFGNNPGQMAGGYDSGGGASGFFMNNYNNAQSLGMPDGGGGGGGWDMVGAVGGIGAGSAYGNVGD